MLPVGLLVSGVQTFVYIKVQKWICRTDTESIKSISMKRRAVFSRALGVKCPSMEMNEDSLHFDNFIVSQWGLLKPFWSFVWS